MAGSVGDGQRVSCLFRRSYINTAGVRGPDGIGLRFQHDGFGVGHAVAELDGLAAMDRSGNRVEVLDSELLSAELFEGQADLFLLLLGSFHSCAIFNGVVFAQREKKIQPTTRSAMTSTAEE